MVAEGEVNQTSIQLTVPNAKLWTAETPYLYSCKAEKDGKTIQMEFGIRLLEWDAKKGFCVNGERILLRGGCIHHDHGVVGACDFRTAEERRIALLKKCGFNAIRMAHNPATQITLEVCDRLGMYVMNETFDAGMCQRLIMIMPDGLNRTGKKILLLWSSLHGITHL